MAGLNQNNPVNNNNNNDPDCFDKVKQFCSNNKLTISIIVCVLIILAIVVPATSVGFAAGSEVVVPSALFSEMALPSFGGSAAPPAAGGAAVSLASDAALTATVVVPVVSSTLPGFPIPWPAGFWIRN